MHVRRSPDPGRHGQPLVVALAVLAAGASCTRSKENSLPSAVPVAEKGAADATSEKTHAERRSKMVAEQLQGRDITHPNVLDAMRRVPRHKFVPPALAPLAYRDRPLPIGHDQTISQPYIVALMTQLVDPKPTAKALDVGTGSGYQAAVLAELVKEVYSIEIVEPLATEARQRLESLDYDNIHVRHDDGYRGWPDQAPFDIILVAAAPDHIPQPLIDQLAPGGTLVIPVGTTFQQLTVVKKSANGQITRRTITPVAFVPMTGEAQR